MNNSMTAGVIRGVWIFAVLITLAVVACSCDRSNGGDTKGRAEALHRPELSADTVVDYYAVRFAPGGTVGFIVGSFGVVLRTTDAGEHWNKVDAGTTDGLKDIAVA